MEASKVITYSLLAQIRNSGNFVNSSVEIFVPIVKYALYKLITQSGVYKGASITEISTWICQYFGLDFPPAVLEKILLKRKISSIIQFSTNGTQMEAYIKYI